MAAVLGVSMASAQGRSPSQLPAGARADKAARAQQELDELHAAPKHKKPSREEGMRQAVPSSTAVVQRSPGINNDMHQGPFPAMEFRVSNFYQGPAKGGWYLVYVGAHVTTDGGAGVGAVRIISESDTNSVTDVGTFDAPVNNGPLYVVAYQGTVLTLATQTGQTITFDLNTLTFS